MRVAFIALRSIHTTRCLEWFVRRGHEVHLITHQPQEIEGVHLHDIGFHTCAGSRVKRVLTLDLNLALARRIKLVLKLRRLLQEIDPDALHLHTLYFPVYYGAFTGFRPMVVSPWNGDVLWTERRSWSHRALVGRALRSAAAVTADNKVMKDTCEARYRVRRERIHEIRWFGADTKHFYRRPKDDDLMRRLGVHGCPVVLSTRALSAGYHIDAVMRAVPLVLKHAPEAKFVFIWPGGDLVEQMAGLARELGVEGSIRMVGTVDYSELPSFYSSADVTVSVASPDSVSASLFESMACGSPSVVSDVAANLEFITDEWNGRVVPPRDEQAIGAAIVELLRDEEKRRLFAERNVALVKEKADYDNEMTKIESLYMSLAARCGKGRKGLVR